MQFAKGDRQNWQLLPNSIDMLKRSPTPTQAIDSLQLHYYGRSSKQYSAKDSAIIYLPAFKTCSAVKFKLEKVAEMMGCFP